MFGLMKSPVKEAAAPADLVKLNEIHKGCVVGFGFMVQKNISGKRIPVTEVNTYMFASDNFVSYRLENDNTDINMIVADEDASAGAYLAMSQRIEHRLFSAIFGNDAPERWFALKQGDALKAEPQTLGTLQGWLTKNYTLAVSMPGNVLAGDYRQRKLNDPAILARPFDYVLLLEEDNEYALEAEKYADGTMNVFATIYRPATDIGEITRAPKSAGTSIIGTSLMNSPDAFKPSSKSIDIIAHESPVELSSNKSEDKTILQKKPVENEPEKEIRSPAIPQDAATVSEALEAVKEVSGLLSESDSKMVEEKKKDAMPTIDASVSDASMAMKPEAIVTDAPKAAVIENVYPALASASQRGPSSSAYEVNTLACDISLAARLIDEAQRNRMMLSNLIRKVIDLTAREQDKVLIPFALDTSEVAELAHRYSVDVTDTEGVKQHIVEELKRFVGKKK